MREQRRLEGEEGHRLARTLPWKEEKSPGHQGGERNRVGQGRAWVARGHPGGDAWGGATLTDTLIHQTIISGTAAKGAAYPSPQGRGNGDGAEITATNGRKKRAWKRLEADKKLP